MSDDASKEDIASALKRYLETGVVPPNMKIESLKTFAARGRVENCSCGLLECVCEEVRQHKDDCLYRLAISCAVPIECEHGTDVCPICSPCKCKEKT